MSERLTDSEVAELAVFLMRAAEAVGTGDEGAALRLGGHLRAVVERIKSEAYAAGRRDAATC